MHKKKCSACGSTETVKILYGEPTLEAIEAVKREEIILGGCCITEVSPAKHCKTCGQKFGGRDSFRLTEMKSFEFFVGGYFGTSHYIYIDGKRKNKVIKYAQTPGGLYVDLKHPIDEQNLHPGIELKDIPLTSDQWFDFIKELTSLEIACWKDKYCDNDICDGMQWDIKISFPQHNKISKFGSNEYPPYWKKFIRIMRKYIDKNIG